MGNDEQKRYQNKCKDYPNPIKKGIKFQNEFLKSKTINKSCINQFSSFENKFDDENINNLNDINCDDIIKGNNSFNPINESLQINNEVKIDDDSINENDIMPKQENKMNNNNNEDNNNINKQMIGNQIIKSQEIRIENEKENNLIKFNEPIKNSSNINNDIEIDNENNNNIITNEIKQNDKDKENEIDAKLKINESKKRFLKALTKEILTNKINEDENQIPEIRTKRLYTFSNIILNYKIPKKVFLYNNPNIFDSILIILNNIIYINDYFKQKESKIENYIQKCEQNKEYCLIGILYYINKYLWTKRPEDSKPKNEMRIMYKLYMEYYIKKYCNNSNPDYYLYDINNIESILSFILSTINSEITTENKDFMTPEFKTEDQLFNNFMNNYLRTNKSFISVNFSGFYLKEEKCEYFSENNNNNHTTKREFSDFNYILFDLKKYNEQNYINQTVQDYSFDPNNNNSNKNIYNVLKLEHKDSKDFFCDVCKTNSKKIINKNFLSLPKVLTIILKNNDGNFEINDEVNLSNQFNINTKYNLISILCKYNNNTYITYCINHQDSNWYYYNYSTSDETVVHKVRYLDINAIPYLLVYQNSEDMKFEYKKIKRKKKILFKFQNGLQSTLYFEPNETVKDAKKEIQRNNPELIKLVLLFNGKILNDKQKLSEFNFDLPNQSILVISP